MGNYNVSIPLQYRVSSNNLTQHANADSLSRLPLENTLANDADSSVSLFNIQQIATLPVDPKQLLLEMSNDSVLSKVLIYTKRRMPS